MEFASWSKIPRFNKEWEITEKVDGTNGVLYWSQQHDGRFDTSNVLATVDGWHLYAGSRNRWLTPYRDNFGFAAWAKENALELFGLGPGRHFGEWYGSGIQRRYGLLEKRFALFNTKWQDSDSDLPKSCEVVTTIATVNGSELTEGITKAVLLLREGGSQHVPGFPNPEGIVIRHIQHGSRFKVLLEGDSVPKSVVAPIAGCEGGCSA